MVIGSGLGIAGCGYGSVQLRLSKNGPAQESTMYATKVMHTKNMETPREKMFQTKDYKDKKSFFSERLSGHLLIG
ncbi:hypothetical protein XELAEV_18040553mg [Xenopus laevis]|uniref:Uncharacterized protein n=1 Tax=Xenopus laevis TaxID=8355 RepID=A0A974H8X5_XENLA|nr:hypothetical protein XELAEV_18040553mg [Xenopus laevis]